ncbi:pyridoxal phosphate-dependent transferase [Trichoderma austrokoningii]
MSPVQSNLGQLAVLGGYPVFPPGSTVPLIQVQGYRPKGDLSAVDAMLANEANEDSKARPSALFPRFFRELETPVRATASLYNAGVGAKDGSNNRKEVIVPRTTIGATIETVIEEGFKPVFVDVNPISWHMSYEGAKRAISDKTAAILTVDWLGTQCDSFGATNGQPPSIGLAHATIYSLGYPKVLTGTGSGGLIVCSKSLVQLIEKDPTGILRREVLAEPNAFLLGGISGITLQQVPTSLPTNHYQISLLINAQVFGLGAEHLRNTLKAENVHCSIDRMPYVGAMEKFASRGRVKGDLKHSRLLATTLVTFGISNMIGLETVEIICGLVKLIHQKAQDILEAKKGEVAPTGPRGSADFIDLKSKYRQHLVIPILDSANSVYSKVFIPRDYMLEHKISIDEFLARFQSRKQWKLNEHVLAELRVDTIIGTTVILAPQ